MYIYVDVDVCKINKYSQLSLFLLLYVYGFKTDNFIFHNQPGNLSLREADSSSQQSLGCLQFCLGNIFNPFI